MIPRFNLSGVLPPFDGANPTAAGLMAPYQTSLSEVAQRFCSRRHA